ncbi:cation diffusion facilitator family transporter [Alienimonas sp. DA493]|uniref:cation diffusion facilitator family transporter n=1 Tax=Alienimonas sp. DA493 TaxID=3373605 RepID=UPI0037544B0A
MDEANEPANGDRSDDRGRLLARGRWVEVASLAYNLTEVGVSVTAGLLTGSSALVSWGADSAVESVSAGTLIWRLRGEEKGLGRRGVLRRKKVALGVLAGAFAVAVAFILYEAIGKLLRQEPPGFNWWGIGILLVSLVVNPALAWAKHRYGKKLDSPALKYDAIDTLICEYQTVVVLIGLGLAKWLGWWWADPAAALLIVPYVAWEGFEAGRDALNVAPDEDAEPSADD